jgi:ubiquinone/menaquinone biosynthesis C-methylase UbiE
VPNQPLPAIDPGITQYYDRAPEEERLGQGAFVLEQLRTREIIGRHAAPPPATVLDVGGAAGAYALPLAQAGYTVHLVDASPRLVAEAERRSAAGGKRLASCRVGDARALDFGDESADIVLLLGPLYHLIEAADRVRALGEARRVLKPGGRLFAAGISRFASALDGLSHDALQDPQFAAIVERDLREGQHRNPTGRLEYFTTAYFHHPDELRAEVSDSGLTFEGLYGLEGPGWLLPDIEARIQDPRRLDDLLRVARALEAEPTVVGVSAHLLAVARKS